MAGEEGMGLGIARRRAVALAIGQIFQDGRHGMGLGIDRQPDAGRQLRAVAQGDEDVLDLAHHVGQADRLGHFMHR